MLGLAFCIAGFVSSKDVYLLTVDLPLLSRPDPTGMLFTVQDGEQVLAVVSRDANSEVDNLQTRVYAGQNRYFIFEGEFDRESILALDSATETGLNGYESSAESLYEEQVDFGADGTESSKRAAFY